ncbi:MAG: multicomponent K+:H+ antiporter subunit E [Oleiphilaceae bacterium]|jgi:multicomponent K+:H+ antiporter subunit E
MLRYISPLPIHALVLWVVWLLLNEITPGHIVLGAILAIGITWFIHPLSDPHPAIKKPFILLLYIGRVLKDIVVSNFIVAKQVLSPNRLLKPAFIALPLDLEEPFPLAVLASTISLTPGTVSADFSDDMKVLYIHVLNLKDEKALIAEIKARYEAPLKEIFGC